MQIVILTALGVGGATLIGAIIGFLFKNISHKFSDVVISFAAGVMLCAAVTGLILPSLESGTLNSLVVCIVGIFAGALVIHIFDKAVPHLHRLTTGEADKPSESQRRVNKVLLFVTAIAIHNIPEGIAAGVGFGSSDTSLALSVAIGIALQNIPEGMVIIGPMLSCGISARRTFFIAAFTGVVEVLGTFLGYFAVSFSSAILPFALSFAGGTMLYIISDEMIPETHAHGSERAATYSLLVGFCLMLVMNTLL